MGETTKSRPSKLLIFVDWFIPGFKAGGPIQSCANLAASLQFEKEIYIITTDRDQGDDIAYPSVVSDTWTTVNEQINVLYLSPGGASFRRIKKEILAIKPDHIYLNSMYSYYFMIAPLLVCNYFGLSAKVILSPRGMLKPGSLQFKKFKKSLFLQVFKILGFPRRLLFHATDDTEANDIKNVFGPGTALTIVKDFPASAQQPLVAVYKEPGMLRCLFVSRISPVKNLLYLIKILQRVPNTVSLAIVGPVEDDVYWNQCRQAIDRLPANITIEVQGAVPNSELAVIYQRHHLFILATHGENFGHVIFESLLNGRPVLISDLTPWKDLTAHDAGWVVSLASDQRYVNIIETAIGWNQDAFDRYCQGAWQYAKQYITTSNLKEQYLQLFS